MSRDALKENVKIIAITDKGLLTYAHYPHRPEHINLDVEVKKVDGHSVRISLGKLAREKFKFIKIEKLEK